MVNLPDWQIVLVGHSPSRSSLPQAPLTSGASGWTLAEVTGVSLATFAFLFHCVNLFPVEPVYRSNASQRAAAATRMAATVRGRRSILLGTDVARAFRLHNPKPMVWTMTRGGLEVAYLPHPSPLSRWWRVPAHRAHASVFLRQEAIGIAWQVREGLPDGVRLPFIEELTEEV